MYVNTIFGQLLQFLSREKFARLVKRYDADKHISKCSSWNQLVILLYAQATDKESLRDIETGLKMHPALWAHLGINTTARSTVAEMNQKRDHRLYEQFFFTLLEQFKASTQTRTFTFSNPLYSLDSTMVELCLSMFDWAKYRTGKGALKLHTLLDNRTLIPEMLVVTPGKHNDGKIAREYMTRILTLEPGSILVFDRAYTDFGWWDTLDAHDLFFVTRTKQNQIIVVNERRPELAVNNIRQDDLVYIGDGTKEPAYAKRLRLVRYYDEERKKEYSFITNNMELSAVQIAAIYKNRWQIELFFKWIKQNLKIKSFFGTSPNAVLSQIWVAMIYYLLLVYIKFQTRYEGSLLEFTRMVQEMLMSRRHLIDLLSMRAGEKGGESAEQLALF